MVTETAGKFSRAIGSILDYGPDVASIAEQQYSRVEIALLTGWTFDYIDSLGTVDSDAVLQIYAAKQKLIRKK